jgi:hypothetical protein
MKSLSRFSAWVVFAALLGLAPFALGQSSASHQGAVGNSVLNYAPTSFLALTFGPRGEHKGGGNGGGCNNQNAGRNDWWGGGGGNGGGCQTVPEGGTTLMYLSLAGLCCFGAIVFRSRRRSGLLDSK